MAENINIEELKNRAKQGDQNAQFNLAQLYKKGTKVDKSISFFGEANLSNKVSPNKSTAFEDVDGLPVSLDFPQCECIDSLSFLHFTSLLSCISVATYAIRAPPIFSS